jgi:hypothetical protein
MMRVVLAFALFPLLSQAALQSAAPVATPPAHAPLTAKVVEALKQHSDEARHMQLNAEQQIQVHFGCVDACKPSPVESKCVTACETTMYQCIDHTGPGETEKDTDACMEKVLKTYKETKGVEKKDEKAEKKAEKKEKKKAKSFLQLARNIDDEMPKRPRWQAWRRSPTRTWAWVLMTTRMMTNGRG